MHFRTMGRDGPLISSIGVGAMSFSDMYGPTTEAESHAILGAALELRVTHIDTANVYGMGKSEAAIGSFLKANPDARDRFHIATKAAITRDAEGRRCFSNAPEHLEAELDGSLRRMGVDHVDLFYVHRREASRPIEEVTETLARLKQSGKIGGFGFSEISPASLRRAQAVAPVTAVQSEYNLGVRSPELGLVQACAELGTALVAFSPLGRSLLTDRPMTADRLDGIGFLKTNPRFVEPDFGFNIAETDKLRALAADYGEPAAALAIAWLLARGAHIVPIPGTRSVAHLRECVRGGQIQLSDDDVARIEAALPVGWAHGDRYSAAQWIGPERYC